MWKYLVAFLVTAGACSAPDHKNEAASRVLVLVNSGRSLSASELFELDSLTHTHDLRMAHAATEPFHAATVDARLAALSHLLGPKADSVRLGAGQSYFNLLESTENHFDRLYPPLTATQQMRLARLRRRFADLERTIETVTVAATPDSEIDLSKRVDWHDGWCSFSADGSSSYCSSHDGTEWQRITPQGTTTYKNGRMRHSR